MHGNWVLDISTQLSIGRTVISSRPLSEHWGISVLTWVAMLSHVPWIVRNAVQSWLIKRYTAQRNRIWDSPGFPLQVGLKLFFFFSQLPSCSNCQCSEVSLERQRHPGRRREPLNVSWNTFRVGEATGEHRQMEESLHQTTVLYGLFFWEGLCLFKTNFMKIKYLRRLQRRGSQSGRAGVAAVTQGRHLGEGGWVLQPRR